MSNLVQHFETYQSYIPFDLLQPASFFISLLALCLVINFRYFLCVLPFWFFFYKLQSRRSKFLYKKIPSPETQKTEIFWSFVSSLIFAGAGVAMGIFWQSGVSQIYLLFDAGLGFWGLLYLPISAFLLAVLHDTYFYWMHRALHHKAIYHRFHKIHHNSLEPSPWASFSFHPIESFLNALFLPIAILILPLHPVVIIFHLTLMTISAIINHLGYEIYPRWSVLHFVGALHHSEHHRVFKANYGLFFTWWDRLCGTETQDFLPRYDLLEKKSHL